MEPNPEQDGREGTVTIALWYMVCLQGAAIVTISDSVVGTSGFVAFFGMCTGSSVRLFLGPSFCAICATREGGVSIKSRVAYIAIANNCKQRKRNKATDEPPPMLSGNKSSTDRVFPEKRDDR